jgi:phosphate transport system protein
MRNRFDRQLMRLNQEMIDMGALCEEMITAAAKVVATRDKELMEDMKSMEEDINQKERDIERICMKLLLQQQPVATDLRVISAALKMVSDMERIGDQASDIAGIIKKESEILDLRENTHLDKMAKATIDMVSRSVKSYVKQNLGIAHEVIEQDDMVDELFSQVKKEVIHLIHDNPEKGEEYIAIVLIAKYFERIGDHASNIAEWVEFAITGEYKGGNL